MKTPNLKIIAYLNPNEGGCEYSKYFTKTWINNKMLHPVAKAIPIDTMQTSMKPRVQLKANGNIVWDKSGSTINTAKLQEFILNNYN